MTKQEEMFRRFDERFKCFDNECDGTGCIPYPVDDGVFEADQCQFHAEYIFPFKQFLQSEIDLALAEREKEIVEIIKDFKFYDWSGEEEIYNQVEEIIERIITKEKTCK